MAITLPTHSDTTLYSYTTGSSSPLTLTKPSGVSTGDYLLILATKDDNAGDFTTPTGYTQVFQFADSGGDDATIAAFYKYVSDALLEGNVSLEMAEKEEACAVLMVVQGADTTTFIDASAVTASLQNDSSPDAPDITTATDGAEIITMVGNRSDSGMMDTDQSGIGSWLVDPPTGFTAERYLTPNTDPGSNTDGAPGMAMFGTQIGDAQMAWAHMTQATAGSVTIGDWTGFTGTRDMKLATFAIKPAATGPTSWTGAASLSGAGSSTISGARTAIASAPLSGVGASSISAVWTANGGASLSGLGSASSGGEVWKIGDVSLSGLGGSTISGDVYKWASALLSGAGDLAVTSWERTAFGLAFFYNSSDLSASGTRSTDGSASLSGGGSLSSSGERTVLGDISLSGVGSLTADAGLTTEGSATLTGIGGGSATGERSVIGDATISGLGSSSVSGVHILTGVSTLSGAGALQSDFLLTHNSSASLSGIGSLAADGDIGGQLTGSATLSGNGYTSVAGEITRIAAVTLSGAGSSVIAGAVQQTLEGAASLSGLGDLSASSVVTPGGFDKAEAVKYHQEALMRYIRNIDPVSTTSEEVVGTINQAIDDWFLEYAEARRTYLGL